MDEEFKYEVPPDRDEQLRELLSYCYVEAGRTDGGAAGVYTDIGMRLKEILDGEQ